MPTITDRTYLLKDQYQDATNLDARVQLHLLFSTNQHGWQRWCFDHYALRAAPACRPAPVEPGYGKARVLEIGCGPAHLWTTNLDRVPPGWQITLSDFSSGMLAQAKQNLHGASQFEFEIVDAQAIPFEAATFDAVIANHMLYHVPDRLKALAEMRRVLKPGSKVYLAANGLSHLRELYELEQRFDPAADFGWSHQAHDFFSLDKGGTEVAQFFEDVYITRYEDALNVTQTTPLVDYMLSMATAGPLRTRRVELQRFIERELAQRGVIHITKESGMFIGTKAEDF